MSQTDTKDFSVTKVVPYDSLYSVNMKNSMAILKYNTDWQNVLSEFRGGMQFLMSIESAIDKGLIDLSKVQKSMVNKIRLDPEKLYRIKKIWHGPTYMTRKRHSTYHTRFIPGEELFHYDNKKLDPNNHSTLIIPLPALDNMTPIGKIREATLLIQISQSVPLYLAFEGMDFDTLIREGGLYHKVGNKIIAKFTPEDLNSKIRKTYKVGRDYYNKTMNILRNKFLENWIPLAIDIHQIIIFTELQEQDIEELMLHGLGNTGQDTVEKENEEENSTDFNFEESEA